MSKVTRPPDSIPVARGITCLRCRHCTPTDATDFSRLLRFEGGRVSLQTEAVVPIHCAKSGRARPAYLWESCPVAEDGFAKARRWSSRGDKRREFGAVELLFWRALGASVSLADLPQLLAATARARHSLQTLRHTYGIECVAPGHTASIAASISARVENGVSFNNEQSAWIAECRSKGLYPNRIRGKSGQKNEEQERLREFVLNGIAERGEPKTWRSVVAHVYYISPAARRARAIKRKAASSAIGSVTAR